MEIKMICKKCKYKPKPDKNKSNENWEVFITKCPKCGGKVSPGVQYD